MKSEAQNIKLKFVRDEKNNDITLFINGREFDSNDYLGIIKNISKKIRLTVPDFAGDFSDTEKENILEMINKINEIDVDNVGDQGDTTEGGSDNTSESYEEEVDPENIPF